MGDCLNTLCATAFTICVATFASTQVQAQTTSSETSSTASDLDQIAIAAKICRDYKSGQYLGCEAIEQLSASEGFIILDAVVKVDWLVEEAARTRAPIFFRWTYQPKDGPREILSNPGDNSDYRWKPKSWVNPAYWQVKQRLWTSNEGLYTFSVYLDPSQPEQAHTTIPIQVGEPVKVSITQ